MSSFKSKAKALGIGTPFEAIARALFEKASRPDFETSGAYWDERYREKGNSGAGSYGRLAEFKAEVINPFVAKNEITSVMEFGTGDGHQLTLAEYPHYSGYDVSEVSVAHCRGKFLDDKTKTFNLVDDYTDETADLTMSLDVIYHLIEDEVYENYMKLLFAAAKKHVIIYASNSEERNIDIKVAHVKHRCFTDWIAANCPQWRQTDMITNRFPYSDADPDNTSFADFYFFSKD